jgi:hypothetical protein
MCAGVHTYTICGFSNSAADLTPRGGISFLFSILIIFESDFHNMPPVTSETMGRDTRLQNKRPGAMSAHRRPLEDRELGVLPDLRKPPKLFNRGLRAVAMKYSNNKQLFLCSSQNFFGGMQFKKVKLEHGADGVLLYFPDVQAIAQLGRKFSATKYRFTITTGTSVSSSFLMLDVYCSTCQNFSVNLCTDVLPDNLPFELSNLKFVLSKRDVKAIVTNEDCDTVRTKLLETNF